MQQERRESPLKLVYTWLYGLTASSLSVSCGFMPHGLIIIITTIIIITIIIIIIIITHCIVCLSLK